jgi:hypothetical protein
MATFTDKPYFVAEVCSEERKVFLLCDQPNGECDVPEDFQHMMELTEETADEDLPKCGSQQEVCDLITDCPICEQAWKWLIRRMENEFDCECTFECKAGDPKPCVVIEFCTEERKALIFCHQPDGSCAVPGEFATTMLGLELTEETVNEDLPECGGSQEEVCDFSTDCSSCEQAWKKLIGCMEDKFEFECIFECKPDDALRILTMDYPVVLFTLVARAFIQTDDFLRLSIFMCYIWDEHGK